MKLFYINGENVMGRDCYKTVRECPIVNHMRDLGFDVRLKYVKNITKVLFENQFDVSDWERGLHVIEMINICNNCQWYKVRENLRERQRQ